MVRVVSAGAPGSGRRADRLFYCHRMPGGYPEKALRRRGSCRFCTDRPDGCPRGPDQRRGRSIGKVQGATAGHWLRLPGSAATGQVRHGRRHDGRQKAQSRPRPGGAERPCRHEQNAQNGSWNAQSSAHRHATGYGQCVRAGRLLAERSGCRHRQHDAAHPAGLFWSEAAAKARCTHPAQRYFSL